MQSDQGIAHVRVLAGTASSGEPVFEVLPARWLGDDYEICGSPGLAYGFAAGDRLRIGDDGSFEVLERGGNVCVCLFPGTRPSDAGVTALTAAFEQLDGLVEMPPDRRFIVITVPVGAGLAAIERAVVDWAAGQDCPWEFGNVYDDTGKPLPWVKDRLT